VNRQGEEKLGRGRKEARRREERPETRRRDETLTSMNVAMISSLNFLSSLSCNNLWKE
jgi:hypothetical protein